MFEKVQGDAVWWREVLCRVSRAFSVQVFAEAHIKHQVQFVLDIPVLAD